MLHLEGIGKGAHEGRLGVWVRAPGGKYPSIARTLEILVMTSSFLCPLIYTLVKLVKNGVNKPMSHGKNKKIHLLS